jgi:uncharacterized membrane protein YkoI
VWSWEWSLSRQSPRAAPASRPPREARRRARGRGWTTGKDLLGQAGISEAGAIAAAQGVAHGALNEVDLEHRAGRLVFNVDVGSHDVKVDAASGQVVAVDSDD